MLTDGELTSEQRYKNRLDAEKDRSKLDPWKVMSLKLNETSSH